MPFFYKHIVPTGLKRCTTGEKHIEKDASVKLCFTKSYLAQVVIFTFYYSFKNSSDYLAFRPLFQCPERLQTAPTGSGNPKCSKKRKTQ